MYYIRGFTFNLKIFLKHCSECQVNQTRRHKSHGALQPIDSLSISFHIIAMDFILDLSISKDGYNCAMLITCKFFKRMTLISKKIIWTAKNWAEALLSRFDIINWGLLKQIINDKDRKYFNEFWQILFHKLEVRLFYNTAYYSQTNNLSERTNQSVEIILRYHFAILNLKE